MDLMIDKVHHLNKMDLMIDKVHILNQMDLMIDDIKVEGNFRRFVQFL